MVKWQLDGNSIYIIKSRVVQVGERHLSVSFLYEEIHTMRRDKERKILRIYKLKSFINLSKRALISIASALDT